MSTPEIYELHRLENIAYDVAGNFGNTGDQAVARMIRLVNRAMIKIAGSGRRWSWLYAKKSFLTVANQREYSLPLSMRDVTEVWIEGSVQRPLTRIPTSRLRELVPDQSTVSGTPTNYDLVGVNSQGAKVISLYPAPAAGLEIFYRGVKNIQPIKDGQKCVRAEWGIPPHIAELVVEVATALAWQGINDKRFDNQVAMVSGMIDEAYADDQENIGTTYRQVSQDEGAGFDDGPRLPAEYGR